MSAMEHSTGKIFKGEAQGRKVEPYRFEEEGGGRKTSAACQNMKCVRIELTEEQWWV